MLGAGCAAMFLAVAATATISSPDISSAVPAGTHMRVKRCSCNNWMDKECIYFCHLDIIWINTGSQMLPYGLGNAGRRRKRASARCQCEDVKDSTCNSFCQNPVRDVAAFNSQVVYTRKHFSATAFKLPSDSTMCKIKS
ncbi:endothelin-2 isoform X3 [Phyllobates terribilis]|uniref:endothelin-2 isoform X3 n=1 Tax=Phyllobates terribilis TaxID=111132 RepID=UPI003CCA7D13